MKYFLMMMLCISSLVATAQKKKAEPLVPVNPSPDSLFSNLKWRNIGPFRGGRANAVSGVVGNDQKFYAGYTGGGLWTTEDGGINWENISDGFFTVGSIGEVAVSESDPNVVYVGTGEHAVRGVMTSYGNGVYKSTDAGKTWKHIGLEKTRHISDIAVHPSNPDLVYVAGQGTVHGPNNDRGVFKSTDGGATWKKVLYINDSTGISSLSMDMNNPRILYATSWEHRRLPWTVSSGGAGSAIWKSTDEGNTWQKLTEGLPKMMGKMGISVSRANSNRVYAILETEKSKSGLYRSDDAGKTWALLSNNQDISSRSWYYMEVFADPINENIVYVLNAPMMKSIDGGKTFARVRVQHGDTHDLWINPSKNNVIALGDDGGAEISFDHGESWSSIMNQPTAQFYRVNTDNVFPYKVYGGQQDNSSVIIASRNNGSALTERDWTAGAGCESAFLAFDPNNPSLVFGGCYQGYIEVLNRNTNESKDVQAYPTLNLAIEPKDMKYRFNWNAPIVVSPHDPKTIYHAGNVLLKTTNGGLSWDAISGDLTRNDKSKQGPGGVPFTNEGAGGENYNTIAYVAESTLENGTIWTGSDCGLVHVTRDGGKTWTNVTPADLPESQINSIELSAFDKGVAYISATRYKLNDYGAYAYKTTDYGNTWTTINKGVKPDDFIKVIREDTKNKSILYAGSERGFYLSTDAGSSWQPFQLNLPIVPVTDLMIRDNDLVAATAGRAFWILDDLGAIQQASTASAVTLFTPKPAYKFGGGTGLPEAKYKAGQNAPEGVILDYILPELTDSTLVTLTITDASGKLIRTYSNKKDASYVKYPGGPAAATLLSAKKGHNRFLWNLRNDNITPDVQNVFVYGSYEGYAVPPGKYKAQLNFNGTISEKEMIVLANPTISATAADWDEQQQVLATITASIGEMHQQVNELRKIRKQLVHHSEILRDLKPAEKVLDEAKKLIAGIDAWESNIVEGRIQNGQDVINWPSRLNVEFFNIKRLADAPDPRITQGIKARLADLQAQWNAEKGKLEAIKKSVAAYNTLYKSQQLEALIF
uniref:WD40/YVTN/BNR-like repeat-containing protein n=1 Tax=Algoriphagus sp. TaxID=1872435 RepID=UPI004047F161